MMVNYVTKRNLRNLLDFLKCGIQAMVWKSCKLLHQDKLYLTTICSPPRRYTWGGILIDVFGDRLCGA